MMNILLVTALCALFTISFAAVPGDLVTTLPGYNGKLPQRHYSGFQAADADETVFLHYWFIEASNNPKTAPLLIWLNGGPGCSSLDGLLTELGSLHFSGRIINDIPELIDNPQAWSQVANVLFIESPAGVGFSWNKNQTYATNDEITSQNNYYFLKNWMKAYSEFANNELYISGESYAGIYVPTFAQRVWEGLKSGDAKFNFKGVLVGNGCWGNNIGACAILNGSFIGTGDEMEFLHNHAMISEPHWEQLNKYCGNYSTPNPSQECLAAVTAATKDGGDYNIYNIYDTCPSPVSKSLRAHTQLTEFLRHNGQPLPTIHNVGTPDECTDTWGEKWLNIPKVQEALHVQSANVSSWSICSDVVGNAYVKTLESALPVYKNLVEQGYRVLIYSGDCDACIPETGSEKWTRELGFKEVAPWAPWTINEQVAGYVTYYEKSFTFLTVKGAGHMVPQVMPEAALTMFTRYLNGGKF